jgi:phage terminase large subunit-like protein
VGIFVCEKNKRRNDWVQSLPFSLSSTTTFTMKNFTVSLFSFLLFINQTLAVSKRGIAWPWFEKHPVSDFYANGKVGWVNIHTLLFMVLLEVVADFFSFW